MASEQARILEIRHAGSPEQLAFWNSTARFRAFVGGVGSGKSRAGAVEVLRQPANSIGMVVAPTYKMLRQATLEALLDVGRPLIQSVPSMPGWSEPASAIESWNKTEHVMTLVNGTTIFVRSAEIPDNLRGPSIGWFWLDEGAMVDAQVWAILIARLRRQPERGWITTTPKGFNWLYHEFVERQDPDYVVIRSHTRDNPFTSESYKRSLESSYDASLAKQELAGEFVEWVATPCYEFSREKNTEPGLKERAYDRMRPLVVCCDFNVRYMCWPIGQEVDGAPVIFDYIEDGPTDVGKMIRLLRDKYPNHPGGIEFYGDATGSARSAHTGRSAYDAIRLEMVDYPSAVVFRTPASNPPVIDRVRAVNRLLRGEGTRLRIDSACEPVITDLLQTEWDATGLREQQYYGTGDPEKEKRSHASSALGYWIYRRWPLSLELALVERKTGEAKIRRRKLYFRRPYIAAMEAH
jgi:hypothetical protein